MKFIEDHNTAAANGEYSFTVGINEYGDLTTEEFVNFMNGYSNESSLSQRDFDLSFDTHDDNDVPNEVDWVNKVA